MLNGQTFILDANYLSKQTIKKKHFYDIVTLELI